MTLRFAHDRIRLIQCHLEAGLVFFNYSTMQMVIKVVYYGPGLCGKTTNLEFIYSKTAPNSRGEMVSLETETDRTLFFDLLPIDVGVIGGFKTRFQLYTVPGQVFYNSTRQLVLKGVDGIIFVADSQTPMLDANLDSFENMKENFRQLDLDYRKIPIVMQYNKRDLQNILPVDVLNRELNKDGFPFVEACAIDGTGVFDTLKLASKHTLMAVKKKMVAQTAAPKVTVAPPVSAPAPTVEPDRTPVSPAVEPKSSPEPEPMIQPEPELEVVEPAMVPPEVTPNPEPHHEPLTTSPNPDLTTDEESDEPDTGTLPDVDEAPISERTPQLTLDDLHESERPRAQKPRKKIKRDMDVDELLSGLVPSKQTFIKKMSFDFDRKAFQQFQEANLILELKDENGNVVETRSFTTRLSKKTGTRKLLLKLNIDLES